MEWQRVSPLLANKQLVSVYFGGGTPSLLGAQAIGEILSWIKQIASLENCEITLEANPEQITLDLMQEYQQVGVNRVSIGLQSLDSELLALLDRTHSVNKGIESIFITAEAGITNISVDLMYEIPHQTKESWGKTLDQLISLPITHLSLYNLTFEPHTVFYKKRGKLQTYVPDPEVSLHMYESAIEKLNQMGLIQYEISAFARDNHCSRHNIGYWTARPFLGLGPSAFSYWENKRFRNVANLNRYTAALKCGLA